MRYLLCLTLLILLAGAGNALAQDAVRVRVGEHDGYSRLVFDWDAAVPYTVDKSDPAKLVIKFEKGAALQSPPGASGNILGVEVLSTAPLQLAIKIPGGSKTRDFSTGERVVLDVYNLPGAPKAVAEAEKTPAAAPEPAKTPAPVIAEKPVEKTAEKPAEEKSAAEKPVETAAPAESFGPQQTVKTTATEPAEEGLTAPVQAQPQKTADAKPKKPGKPTLVTISATEAQGMAVFEMNDEVWMVTDLVSDTFMNPQVSGPAAKQVGPVEPVMMQGGKAYKARRPPDKEVRVQGAGLLWHVVMASGLRVKPPVRPLREEVEDGKIRSGKITWPIQGARAILSINDPVSGATIKVVTVESSKQFGGPAMDFVDFRTLKTAAGLAFISKVDDLEIKVTPKGVEISRPGGLALTSEEGIMSALTTIARQKSQPEASKSPRIYEFKNWELGGVKALVENHSIILAGLSNLSESGKVEGIMTLAKMYLANAQGSEALGFLEFIEDKLPALADNPKFVALRAAAKALDWRSEEAFADFGVQSLDQFEEIGYWKAFTLADLGDWIQASDVMPANLNTLFDYPETIFNRLGPVLAEVALRSGNVKQADQILEVLEDNKTTMFVSQRAALEYLKGEAARQRGDVKETKSLWQPLMKGKDDLYRAKAGLAMTRLQADKKEITTEKAIDNLERLRYAWRGDELEAQINYWLGRAYFDSKQYAKGLTIMREASTLAEGTDLGRRVTSEIAEEFSNLFLGPKIEEISPLDAAALYEQFFDLLPKGAEGDKIVQRLAERLVQGDLLGRAGDLLVGQLEHRLQGLEAYDISMKLAAIYLLDGEPAKAMKVIDQAATKLETLPVELKTPVRSLSRQGRPDQALALLNGVEKAPEANRLRADIAWNAGYWDDAAIALEDVIIDQNLSLTRPLDDENATLVLHRAVALNLATDRIALANMREKYSDAMAQTDKARIFEVITRPRQSATLADRETLKGIVAEVDLFADFLKSYKSVSAPPSN